ncbi:MAG TPA: tetratricopeptide repeat protein [Candidatus Cryosericum sp.]|nr:tetratricopeptide repeat protein [Candidatus Cryosericum sp.]
MAGRTAGPGPTWLAARRHRLLTRRLVLGGLLCALPAGFLPFPAQQGDAAPAAGASACRVALAGYDAGGHRVFRTIALALDRPGLVVTPLHTLERGGARWERLAVEEESAGSTAAEVVGVASLDPAADLAYLSVPGSPSCAAQAAGDAAAGAGTPAAPAGQAGTQVLVLRERSGYRPPAAGGQILRQVALPGGRRLILARLLDARGAEPGLMIDASGALVGSVAPAPPGSDQALLAVVAAAPPPSGEDSDPTPPRSVLAARAAPTFSGTPAGIAAQALLLGGAGRTESAIESLDDALLRGGETAALLLERGTLQYASGRLPAAVRDFSRAAQVDPSSYLARFNLGVVLGASGRYDEAAAAFREARDLAPSNPRVRFELALALRAGDHGEAARGELETLDRLDPTLARELRLLLGF